MTIKLKCPYSEEELEEIKKIRNNFTNTSVVCPFCGGPVDYKNELSIALMQTQHDLEIATKALEDIKNDALTKNRYHIIADINYALEQITHDNSEKPNSHEHKE